MVIAFQGQEIRSECFRYCYCKYITGIIIVTVFVVDDN